MNSIEKLIKQQPEDWSLKQEFYKQTDIYELEIKKHRITLLTSLDGRIQKTDL